jgi:hypothetical protein
VSEIDFGVDGISPRFRRDPVTGIPVPRKGAALTERERLIRDAEEDWLSEQAAKEAK